MDRDKLIEVVRLAIARVLDFKADKRELELLADHLIANGIGYITTDKLEKALEEAYEEIKKLKEFQLDVAIILGTTKKQMLEEIQELKHRADVAEEALKILCKNCVECPYVTEDNNKYCKAVFDDETGECDASKAYLCWVEYYKQQAEQRLKERK